MGNKQVELENVMQLEIYDLTGGNRTETWWDELQSENTAWAISFQKDRLGSGGRVIAVYVRELDGLGGSASERQL